jgi:hypothetical protein
VIALFSRAGGSGGGGHHFKFRVSARSEASTSITSLQLVVNGKVTRVKLDPTSTPYQASGTVDVPFSTDATTDGMWVCGVARANDTLLSDEELDRYTDTVVMRVQASRQRFAHTSPVYVTVDGNGAHVAASVAEGDAVLDYFGRFARGAADPQLYKAVEEAIAQANVTLHSTPLLQ